MDPVGLYAEALIREYLSKRGCTRTLAAFDAEQPRTSESISSKLQIVKGLRLSKLVQKNKDKADGGYATLLEMVIEYMHGKALAAAAAGEGDGATAAPRSDRPGSSAGRRPEAPAPAASPMGSAPLAGRSGTSRGWNMDEEPAPVVERAPIRVAPAPAPATRYRADLAPAASAPVAGAAAARTDPSRPAARKQSSNWASGELEMADVDDELDGLHIGGGRTAGAPAGGAYRPSSGPSAPRGAETLSAEEGREIRKLVFGSATGADFPSSWRQGLFFTENQRLRYGLEQIEGGPCGLLAVVQAFILKYIAFRDESAVPQRPPQPTATERERALVEALAEILWQAGDRRRARFALYGGEAGGRIRDDRFSVVDVSGVDALRALLASRLGQIQYRSGCGVVMVLYSAILTRGVANIRKDMDMSDATLIGSHGYCTQELVNLLLMGRAHSNVFDGERRLDEQILRGIPRRSDVGYLTLFETYKYVEVGKNYKIPSYPIWVICSESHYTVLFSLDRRLVDEARAPPARFDLFYYDELARQDEEIRLTIDTRGPAPTVDLNSKTDLTPPIENCIRTKWPTAKVDWNGTEPLL
eukprot:tig00000404_g395.t1